MTHDEAALCVQPVVGYLASWICQRFPELDRQEVISECQPVAWKAILSYQEEKGASLKSWVHTCVWAYLRDRSRGEKWRNRVARKVGIPLSDRNEEEIPEKLRFDLDLFEKEISIPAVIVIHLVLKEGITNKRELYTLIRQRYDWTKPTIDEIFQEITEALAQ